MNPTKNSILFSAFLFLFGAASFCEGQPPAVAKQSPGGDHKGSYKAIFVNLFGGERFESVFDVDPAGAISGKISAVEILTENLQGVVKSDGKFQARATNRNGVIFTLSGTLPLGERNGVVSLSLKSVEKGKGSKSVSESTLTGFIAKFAAPAPANKPAEEIADNGKNRLLFQNAEILFPGEWLEPVITVSQSAVADKSFQVIELKSEAADAVRYLRMALPIEPGKKKWLAEEKFAASYRETKAGTQKTFMFAQAGSVEIASDTERETVWKIFNLQLRRIGGKERLRIDGFIRVLK